MITNTKKQKLKSRVEFGISGIQCYLNEEEKETEKIKRENKKGSQKLYNKKKYIGTKLITNNKKLKLKI